MNRLGSQRVRMSFLASALLAGSLQAMNLGEIWRYFKWPITIAVMVVLALASWALASKGLGKGTTFTLELPTAATS